MNLTEIYDKCVCGVFGKLPRGFGGLARLNGHLYYRQRKNKFYGGYIHELWVTDDNDKALFYMTPYVINLALGELPRDAHRIVITHDNCKMIKHVVDNAIYQLRQHRVVIDWVKRLVECKEAICLDEEVKGLCLGIRTDNENVLDYCINDLVIGFKCGSFEQSISPDTIIRLPRRNIQVRGSLDYVIFNSNDFDMEVLWGLCRKWYAWRKDYEGKYNQALKMLEDCCG